MGLADELEKLEDLRRRGTLTDEEFGRAKEAVLAGGAALPGDHLAEIRHQNELARLDREWEIERERLLVWGRYGPRVPSFATGLLSLVGGGLFGMVWTAVAFAITSASPDVGPFPLVKVAMPLFGAAFTVSAVAWGIHCLGRARQYDLAYRSYRARRARLAGGSPLA